MDAVCIKDRLSFLRRFFKGSLYFCHGYDGIGTDAVGSYDLWCEAVDTASGKYDTAARLRLQKIAVILFISYELCRMGNKVNTKEGLFRIFVFGALAAEAFYF